MNDRIRRKAGCAILVFTLFAGLFGCKKKPEDTVNDVTSVSISCGHMNYYHCYSFVLTKSEVGWLFSAECFTDAEQPRAELENLLVTDGEAQGLLHLIREQDVIAGLQKYKEPKRKFHVLDQTTYYTAIGLADGKRIAAATLASHDIEAYFYCLAKKYRDTQS